MATAHKTRHKGWFEKCVRSVRKSGSAADAKAVCGSVLKKKRANPKESDIIYEKGSYWVLKGKKGFEIYKTGVTHSTGLGEAYADKSLAIARVDYLAKRESSKGNPKRGRGKGRHNPASSSAAMYESFHGTPSSEIVEVEEREHYHGNLAALGTLVSMKVTTVSGYTAELGFSVEGGAAKGNPGWVPAYASLPKHEADELAVKMKRLGLDVGLGTRKSERDTGTYVFVAEHDAARFNKMVAEGKLPQKHVPKRNPKSGVKGWIGRRVKAVKGFSQGLMETWVNPADMRKSASNPRKGPNWLEGASAGASYAKQMGHAKLSDAELKAAAEAEVRERKIKDKQHGIKPRIWPRYKLGFVAGYKNELVHKLWLKAGEYNKLSDEEKKRTPWSEYQKQNPDWSHVHALHAKAEQADSVFHDAVVKQFGKARAGDMRYRSDLHNAETKAAGKKKHAADEAYLSATRAARASNPRRSSNPGSALLCSNEAGTQLYIEGGDQSLDLPALHMDGDWERDSMVIGDIREITYRTQKDFDKFKTIDYYHQLGEETGDLPALRYDHMNKKLYIDGGLYRIEQPALGTSPGIEN